MRRTAPLLAALAAVAVACGPSGGDAPGEGAARCETGLDVPAGFHITGSDEIRQVGWIAVRESYRDENGRALHVIVGLAGEFGEGLPAAGTLVLAGGGEARLVGEGTSWLAVWDQGGPCSQRVVGGEGFGRGGFVRVLGELGVT